MSALRREWAGFLALLLRADLRPLEPSVSLRGPRTPEEVMARLVSPPHRQARPTVRVVAAASAVPGEDVALRVGRETSPDAGVLSSDFVGHLRATGGTQLVGRIELPKWTRGFVMVYRGLAWVLTGLVLLGAAASLVRGDVVRAVLLVPGAAAPLVMVLALYVQVRLAVRRRRPHDAALLARLEEALGAEPR